MTRDFTSFLSISSNTPSTFLHSRNTHASHPHLPARHFHPICLFCGTFPSLCLFLATSFSSIQPGGLSGGQQERQTPQRTPPPPPLHPKPRLPSCNRLCTKATKPACVNISVAPAPRPGSRCSLSAGPRCESLCVPWQRRCVLPDVAAPLWRGSSACKHAVAGGED